LSFTLSVYSHHTHTEQHSFPTRRSSDLEPDEDESPPEGVNRHPQPGLAAGPAGGQRERQAHPDQEREARLDQVVVGVSLPFSLRSEEHTSELQSLRHLVCRLLLEKKKNK